MQYVCDTIVLMKVKTKEATLVVRMEKQMHAALKKLAAKQGVRLGEYVRRLCERELQKPE